MAGVNPYIEPAKYEPAKKKYKITFLPMKKVIEVDPAKVPYGRTGLPGSILDIAMAHDLEVDQACGGVCACSNEPTDDEQDMLDDARGLTTESRLACQCVPNGKGDLEVRIPEWNRNLVKEDH
jgi:2Fe-2S ferredoxin